MEKEPKLFVRNIEQKLILLCEMQGQISDGMWENSRPLNHWKFWCNLDKDTIVVNPNNVGVLNAENANFKKRMVKRNYNFSDKALLSIVGERIVIKINLYKILGDKFLDLLFRDHWTIPDNAMSYENALKRANNGDKYYVAKFDTLKKFGVNEEVFKKAANFEGGYTDKDLVRDCKDLKVIFKTDANKMIAK